MSMLTGSTLEVTGAAAAETSDPDALLVAAILAGDSSALDALVDRYFGMVFSIALAHLRNQDDAEDLAQESFIRAYLFLDRLKQPACFSSWLALITRNLARDRLRHQHGAARHVRLVPLVEEHMEIPDRAWKGARETMQKREDSDSVNKAMDQLTAEQRELLLLHFMEELTQEQIAQRLQVHRSSVSRGLARALKSLRKIMGEQASTALSNLQAPGGAKARTLAILTGTVTLSASQKSAIAAAVGAGYGAEVAGMGGSVVTAKTVAAAKVAAILVALGLAGGGYYIIAAGERSTDTEEQAPVPMHHPQVVGHPMLSAVLKNDHAVPFQWSGTLETQYEPVSASERKLILSQLDEQKKAMQSLTEDPAMRLQNNEALDKAAHERLSSAPTMSTFTLHYDGASYLWQVQKKGTNTVFATTRKPGYTDFIGVVPVSAGNSISLSRKYPDTPQSAVDEIPWAFDLQRIANAYGEARVTGTVDRPKVTFLKHREGNGRLWPSWPAMRLTYDAAISDTYPVLVEMLETGSGLATDRPQLTVAVNMGKPASTAIPRPHVIGVKLFNKQHTTVTVEQVDYHSRVSIEKLTRWPAGTVVSDWRFKGKHPEQYAYRSDMTEREIQREVYGWLTPLVTWRKPATEEGR